MAAIQVNREKNTNGGQMVDSALEAEVEDLALRVPGVSDLYQDRFVPIELLFGQHDFVYEWPTEHVRSLPDPRWTGDGNEMLWLVRSPWPAIDIELVVKMVWKVVLARRTSVREEGRNTLGDREAVQAFFKDGYRIPVRRLLKEGHNHHDGMDR